PERVIFDVAGPRARQVAARRSGTTVVGRLPASARRDARRGLRRITAGVGGKDAASSNHPSVRDTTSAGVASIRNATTAGDSAVETAPTAGNSTIRNAAGARVASYRGIRALAARASSVGSARAFARLIAVPELVRSPASCEYDDAGEGGQG